MCVVDSLDCLRHHVVISSDDDDGDVGDLGTTGTHSGERLVTRGIKERDLLACAGLHLVCTDVLGDTASLASHHVGASDEVQQFGLTVVDVTHDGDDRSSRYKVFRIVRLVGFRNGFLHVHALELDLETEFLCHHLQDLSIQTLVD